MEHWSGRNSHVSAEQPNPPFGVIRDRQLATINLSLALFKWDHGMACNLKEVAVVTGYYYGQVRRWDLPLFEGKITRSEFFAWKRKKMAKSCTSDDDTEQAPRSDTSLGPATAARQRRSMMGNLKPSIRTADSPPNNFPGCSEGTMQMTDVQDVLG